MLRRPKHSEIEVVAPKEQEEEYTVCFAHCIVRNRNIGYCILVRTRFFILPPSLMWKNSCSSEAACCLWTLSFIVQRAVKECGGVKLQLHPFFSSSVDGGEW